MRPSNVQTRATIFTGFEVKPVAADIMEAAAFDWAGVNIGIQTNHERHENGSYFLFLRFIVDNEKGKQCPYSFDVQVMGRFDYVGPDDDGHAEDLIVVNGLSILYGAVRELCAIITSRMPHGAICLPGANFMDHRPSLKAASVSQADDGQKPAARRRARRKVTDDKTG
jgi:preprotein translocase subunit SecB